MTQAAVRPLLSRVEVRIRGAVQGVGFRPFIYRLALDLGIRGWVSNTPAGVIIDAEADGDTLSAFLSRIERQKPPHAIIEQVATTPLPPAGFATFEIHHSETAGAKTALILPDLATCPECLRELFDSANRRCRYPFTNCTHCGPRFTIIEGLPYDRPATTMKHFPLCPACQAEYGDPLDRRFHAQPNACPVCGPQLAYWNRAGDTLAQRDDALKMAEEAIRRGDIVAVKGLGGFHLMCDARNEQAVQTLRDRKHRPDKPLALMVPSIEQAESLCDVSELERELLQSPEAPIVLLRRKPSADVAPQVTPGNPYLGVMLPSTPLHWLLLTDLGFPVVATSGNLSGEPICIAERDALRRLNHIADSFLVHNRPIARHADDSIVRVMAGREQIVRRARGYAPLPIDLPIDLPNDAPAIIATGSHLKNTMAMAVGRRVFISQHIGDLDTPEAMNALRRVTGDFQRLYAVTPRAVACDLHPDYASTRLAGELAAPASLPVIRVQHHEAHILACMADNGIDGPVLGVSWDGTGYGTDATIWGGEFLRVDLSAPGFERVAHFAPFRLPGGDWAVREPRRVALSLLYATCGDAAFDMDLPVVRSFTRGELGVLRHMLHTGTNAPFTSSAGRLFDGLAALIGLRERTSFEGQAAMDLEFAAEAARDEGKSSDRCYPFAVTPVTTSQGANRWIIEWKPLINAVVEEMGGGTDRDVMAATWHATMTSIVFAVARLAGENRVVLSGGCFQNRRLLEHTVNRLTSEGFTPYWHRRVPPNDGGIALGQIVGAARALSEH